MKKNIFIALILGILITTFQTGNNAAETCQNEYGYVSIGNGICVNYEKGILYKKYNDDYNFYLLMPEKFGQAFKGSKKTLYGAYCGKKCNFDGTNCSDGFCLTAKKACDIGYTEFTKLKNENIFACTNPKTKLSYYIDRNKNKIFYLNGEYCGQKCNSDGTNCYEGYCNINDCNKKAGFTTIKDGKCHNPNTKLSYNKNLAFSLNGESCGYKCNSDGTNCYGGYCNVNDCNKKAGYSTIKNGNCYNPNTKLSYNKNHVFYFNGRYCGENCNLEGKNCISGACTIPKCAQGFVVNNEFYCENKQSNIKYIDIENHNSVTRKFYIEIQRNKYKKHSLERGNKLCGYNCDLNGKNCARGFCTKSDCAPGYDILFAETHVGNQYYTGHALCYNPRLKLAYDRNNTFYKIKKETEYVNFGYAISYYFPYYCGTNCDKKGKNCKVGKCRSMF